VGRLACSRGGKVPAHAPQPSTITIVAIE
jgi:hypothetical protein